MTNQGGLCHAKEARIVLPGVPMHLIQGGNNRQDRFFSEEDYVLGCYRDIELNPVHAGMVDYLGAQKWSSYAADAKGKGNLLLQPHPSIHFRVTMLWIGA